MGIHPSADRLKRYVCSLIQRISVHPRRNPRKCNAAASMLQRQIEASGITGCQKFRVLFRSAVDRSDGMNDVFRVADVIGFRDLRISRRTAVKCPALRQKFRSRCTVNCPLYSQYANIITMVTADHLSLSSFSISSIVGIELLNSSGITLLSLYSDMPIGTLIIFTAYCARTLSLVLHIRSPTV